MIESHTLLDIYLWTQLIAFIMWVVVNISNVFCYHEEPRESIIKQFFLYQFFVTIVFAFYAFAPGRTKPYDIKPGDSIVIYNKEALDTMVIDYGKDKGLDK